MIVFLNEISYFLLRYVNEGGIQNKLMRMPSVEHENVEVLYDLMGHTLEEFDMNSKNFTAIGADNAPMNWRIGKRWRE